MRPGALVAFWGGEPEGVEAYLGAVQAVRPELEFFVVSEFPVARGRRISFRPKQPAQVNLERIRWALRDHEVVWAAARLGPGKAQKQARGLARALTGRVLLFLPDGAHFPLHPRAIGAMVRYVGWRTREWLEFQRNPGGDWHTLWWRMRHWAAWERPWLVAWALRRRPGAREGDPAGTVGPLDLVTIGELTAEQDQAWRARFEQDGALFAVVSRPWAAGAYTLGGGPPAMVDRAKWEALGPWAFQDACVQAWRQGWRTEGSGEMGERPQGAEWLALLRRNFVDSEAFGSEWRKEIARLNRLAAQHVPDEGAMAALRLAAGPAPANVVPLGRWSEGEILAATSGRIRRYAGERTTQHPVVMVVSPYLPYPLSHGGAVRMFNLMRQAAQRFDLVLVSYVERAGDPPPELRALCREIVLVERKGSHDRELTGRPEMVEEFDQAAMRAAIELTVARWDLAVAQIEFTWMAQFARACGHVPKILVEHDITFDLWEQRVKVEPSPDNRRELEAWRRFETAAWSWFDRVAVMSEVDASKVGSSAVVIPNGVDCLRFQAAGSGEDRRVLFVGSFRHRPNLEGLAWLAREVWPRLKTQGVVLEVIAGMDHEAALGGYGERIEWPAGAEVRGFVADVHPSYERAALALAPLVTSAGTNIKVLEAMAMGKAVVSTRAGVNGLRFDEGVEIGVARDAGEFAVLMDLLLSDREARVKMGRAAREAALRFDWVRVGEVQAGVYEELAGRLGSDY